MRLFHSTEVNSVGHCQAQQLAGVGVLEVSEVPERWCSGIGARFCALGLRWWHIPWCSSGRFLGPAPHARWRAGARSPGGEAHFAALIELCMPKHLL